MNKPVWIVAALGCVAVWIAVLPELGSDFRAEDFLAFDYYGSHGLSVCFHESHLGAFIVRFFRPLGDAFTWCMVRGLGASATAHHLVLGLLHLGTAFATFRAARRLCRLPVLAAGAAAMLALAHPLAATDLLYVDGGVPQLLLALCTMAALASLGRWRGGGGGAVWLWLWTALGVMSFDVGVGLPVLLVLVGLILPRARRSVPWGLLLLVPGMVAWRLAVLGELGGYGLPLNRDTLSSLWHGYPVLAACTLIPVFAEWPGDLHAAAWRWITPLCLVAAPVLAFVLSRLRGRSTPDPAADAPTTAGWRTVLALGLVAVALLVPAGVDAALAAGAEEARANGPQFLTMAYRLVACTAVLSLALATVVTRLGRGQGAAAMLAALPLVVCFVWLGRPLRGALADAGDQVTTIREDLARQVDPEDPRPVFLFGTPLVHYHGRREVSRVLNFGLSVSGRPPFCARALRLYPVFEGPAQPDDSLKLPTLQRLLSYEGLQPFQYRTDLGRVEPVPERPLPPPPSVRIAARSGAGGDAVTDPITVPVTGDGALVVRVEGDTSGSPVLHLFNPIHQFYAAELPFAGASLRRVVDPETGADVLYCAARQILEIVSRHPGELVLAVLEVRPAPGASGEVRASNVLAMRLVPES